jgi:hypothetical protein
LVRGAEQLAGLVGARLLVGLTYVDEAGTELSSTQFCGRVLDVADGVIVVANPEGRDPIVLPADTSGYTRAKPGRYMLRDSGEVVVDPDFLTAWTVTVGEAGQAPPTMQA